MPAVQFAAVLLSVGIKRLYTPLHPMGGALKQLHTRCCISKQQQPTSPTTKPQTVFTQTGSFNVAYNKIRRAQTDARTFVFSRASCWFKVVVKPRAHNAISTKTKSCRLQGSEVSKVVKQTEVSGNIRPVSADTHVPSHTFTYWKCIDDLYGFNAQTPQTNVETRSHHAFFYFRRVLKTNTPKPKNSSSSQSFVTWFVTKRQLSTSSNTPWQLDEPV